MMCSRDERTRQLLIAAALGDVERVRYLLEKQQLPVDSSFDGKPSALCYAAMKGNQPLVEYLLMRGADVNYADAMGQTPLIYATLTGHATIIRYLLWHGADPDHRNCAGATALMFACRHHKACCLAALMEFNYQKNSPRH